MQKFSNVSPEFDTKIYSIDYIKIDGYDCRHEAWSWDGVLGESLIFCTKDFENPKKEVLQIVASYINEKIDEKKHTIKIKDEFVFFNYNLEIL